MPNLLKINDLNLYLTSRLNVFAVTKHTHTHTNNTGIPVTKMLQNTKENTKKKYQKKKIQKKKIQS
jgi:hypothetical protein